MTEPVPVRKQQLCDTWGLYSSSFMSGAVKLFGLNAEQPSALRIRHVKVYIMNNVSLDVVHRSSQ